MEFSINTKFGIYTEFCVFFVSDTWFSLLPCYTLKVIVKSSLSPRSLTPEVLMISLLAGMILFMNL